MQGFVELSTESFLPINSREKSQLFLVLGRKGQDYNNKIYINQMCLVGITQECSQCSRYTLPPHQLPEFFLQLRVLGLHRLQGLPLPLPLPFQLQLPPSCPLLLPPTFHLTLLLLSLHRKLLHLSLTFSLNLQSFASLAFQLCLPCYFCLSPAGRS